MVETHGIQKDRVEPSVVRYIKLGPGNAWADACIDDGRIAFGHSGVPHDSAALGDWEAVKATLADQVSSGKATDFLREVREFYELDETCLWITFHKGR